MRALFLALLIASSVASMAVAQISGSSDTPGVLQKFNGVTSQTTPAFTVPDKCEVRWRGFRNLNITVLADDGSVVAGAAGPLGALYLPKGGSYHLQIDSVAQGMSSNPQNQGSSRLGQFDNGAINNGPSGQSQDQNHSSPYNAPNLPSFPWMVEVVDMSTVTPSPLITMPPNYQLPASAVASAGSGSTLGTATPAAVPAPATPSTPAAPLVKLTEDQARSVVVIKGDVAEGTGFMVKMPDGPAIVTNLHVIANNPNIKITTNSGALVEVISEKGAADRDLALLYIKDAGYNYLDVAPDISKITQTGDEVITPGNSEGGEVMLNTDGKVLGIGPDRIEFDNPIYHGNSGGPVFHTKSGKVIGVVTEAIKVDTSDALDKASFASRNSAISGSMRYFGLRLDTVPNWITLDPRTFKIETAFLEQFNKRSRCIDCYLNAPDDDKPEDTLWRDDRDITKANSDFFDQANGSADTGQQMDADRIMWSEFSDIANSDMTAIQNPNNFYSFDRERVADEISYRKAIQAELKEISSNVSRLGSLPRSNSSQNNQNGQ